MLSKLGNLSAAESTEYLTSTMNSYKLETEDAIKVVDKLIAVDNKSATSAKELATALRYAAASASEAGVSIEQLISYIATISSTTRQNAEMIGQGLKTIFTRMEDIKAGAIDEDGLGINNVEIALGRVKIPLRDTTTTFRDMGDVLEQVAENWDTLNDIQQADIAKAIAGVRQRNNFIVLMQNMNQALEYQEIQLISAGIAADRYQVYLEGVEAAQNELKASMESLWQSGISSGLIKSLIDASTWIVTAIDDFGGLTTALIIATATLVTFKSTLIATTLLSIGNWIKTITVAVGSLTYALKTGTVAAIGFQSSLILIVGAIGILAAIAGGIYYFATANERLTK